MEEACGGVVEARRGRAELGGSFSRQARHYLRYPLSHQPKHHRQQLFSYRPSALGSLVCTTPCDRTTSQRYCPPVSAIPGDPGSTTTTSTTTSSGTLLVRLLLSQQ
eukprot:1495026-Rhodomonas_salina.5